MVNGHYLGHRQRLKAKLAQNVQGLLDYELLEVLLGYALPRKDTKPMAKALLGKFKNFKNILLASKQDLLSVPGLGEGFYLFLLTIKELLFRAEQQKFVQGDDTITSPEDVFNLFKFKLSAQDKEEFWIVLLNTKNKIIKIKKLAQGTVDSAPVYFREILEGIFESGAKSFILIHNHPSGDPEPSAGDKIITEKMQQICTHLEINFLDHVIIGKDNFFSFKQELNCI
ncbi:MAG: DNA repair protein RadC [Desulfonauticus sp.]|nr:DNA repair protein RadC [Desulfonauticus sp.]